MGIFARQKAAERLEHRLMKLEDLCSGLERDRRKLDLEFTELYDKVRHQMSRMAKRASADAKQNGEDLPVPEVPDEFAHLDPVSRSIMMRRAKGAFK